MLRLLLLYLGLSLNQSFDNFSKSSRTWVVIISTSRYWFNYRHTSNALTIYNIARRLGIPDRQIILMLADDHSCSPKNELIGSMFNLDYTYTNDLYSDDIEIDYVGSETNPDNVLRLLSGIHYSMTPLHKQLLSGENDTLLFYMTGHGGDGFMKFHDKEELASHDLAVSFQLAKEKGKFKNALVIFDTCQASTLYEPFNTSGIVFLASSFRGQNSYAVGYDPTIGMSLSDGFSRTMYNFFSHHFEDAMGTLQMKKLEKILKLNVNGSDRKPGNITRCFEGQSSLSSVEALNLLPLCRWLMKLKYDPLVPSKELHKIRKQGKVPLSLGDLYRYATDARTSSTTVARVDLMIPLMGDVIDSSNVMNALDKIPLLQFFSQINGNGDFSRPSSFK
jgi:glycosylphosphatidylinositol transamidase (GPIT) subunit GPI8